MKKILSNSLSILFIAYLITGCAEKNEIITKMESKINNVTHLANDAIKTKKVPMNSINSYLNENYPEIMNEFKNYDLRFDNKNKITTVLVCKKDRALFEDLSCDKKINNNYTKEYLACNFYVEYPSCN